MVKSNIGLATYGNGSKVGAVVIEPGSPPLLRGCKWSDGSSINELPDLSVYTTDKDHLRDRFLETWKGIRTLTAFAIAAKGFAFTTSFRSLYGYTITRATGQQQHKTLGKSEGAVSQTFRAKLVGCGRYAYKKFPPRSRFRAFAVNLLRLAHCLSTYIASPVSFT